MREPSSYSVPAPCLGTVPFWRNQMKPKGNRRTPNIPCDGRPSDSSEIAGTTCYAESNLGHFDAPPYVLRPTCRPIRGIYEEKPAVATARGDFEISSAVGIQIGDSGVIPTMTK